MTIKFKTSNLNYKECNTTAKQILGLMFQLNPKPLIFNFEKPDRYIIHSLFCFKKFLAIYLLDEDIVDIKVVEPFKISIKPNKKFNKLVEVPL